MSCAWRDPVRSNEKGGQERSCSVGPLATGLVTQSPHTGAQHHWLQGKGRLGPYEAGQGHSGPPVPARQAAHSSDRILQLQYSSSLKQKNYLPHLLEPIILLCFLYDLSFGFSSGQRPRFRKYFPFPTPNNTVIKKSIKKIVTNFVHSEVQP